MIMREHNQTINNQSEFGHGVGGGIALEVLWYMIIRRDPCHIEHSTTSTQSTQHTFLGCPQNPVGHSFHNRQLVQLVGVLLVVVTPTIVPMNSTASPYILAPTGKNGRLLANRHRGEAIHQTVQLHLTTKRSSSKWFATSL